MPYSYRGWFDRECIHRHTRSSETESITYLQCRQQYVLVPTQESQRGNESNSEIY